MRLVSPSPWQRSFSFRQLLGRLGSCRALVGRKLLAHPGVKAYAASEKHWPILHSLGDGWRNVQTLTLRRRSAMPFANFEACTCTQKPRSSLSIKTQQIHWIQWDHCLDWQPNKMNVTSITSSWSTLDYWVLKEYYVGFNRQNIPPFRRPFQACIRTYGGHHVPIVCFQVLTFRLPCCFSAN